jgi:hypothetical protein
MNLIKEDRRAVRKTLHEPRISCWELARLVIYTLGLVDISLTGSAEFQVG